LNPDFETALNLSFFFEKTQNLKFCVIDGDGAGDFDTIGELHTTMGSIMGAKSQTFSSELQ